MKRSRQLPAVRLAAALCFVGVPFMMGVVQSSALSCHKRVCQAFPQQQNHPRSLSAQRAATR